jgi:hypothetical protein
MVWPPGGTPKSRYMSLFERHAYIEPVPPGSLEPSPWINGDADYSNWGINSTNIMLYNGDGWAWGFCEMYPGATLADYNSGGGADLSAPGTTSDVQIGSQSYTVNYNGSWGAPHPNDNLQWLAMYACQILEDDTANPSPWLRWGPAFNGLPIGVRDQRIRRRGRQRRLIPICGPVRTQTLPPPRGTRSDTFPWCANGASGND